MPTVSVFRVASMLVRAFAVFAAELLSEVAWAAEAALVGNLFYGHGGACKKFSCAVQTQFEEIIYWSLASY